jgi:hemolysin-activating ACP:hemolysin acyltransferase
MPEIEIIFRNETEFDVYHDGKPVAWCQWSFKYELWRCLMLSDKHLYHLTNMDEIKRIISDELAVDFE